MSTSDKPSQSAIDEFILQKLAQAPGLSITQLAEQQPWGNVAPQAIGKRVKALRADGSAPAKDRRVYIKPGDVIDDNKHMLYNEDELEVIQDFVRDTLQHREHFTLFESEFANFLAKLPDRGRGKSSVIKKLTSVYYAEKSKSRMAKSSNDRQADEQDTAATIPDAIRNEDSEYQNGVSDSHSPDLASDGPNESKQPALPRFQELLNAVPPRPEEVFSFLKPNLKKHGHEELANLPDPPMETADAEVLEAASILCAIQKSQMDSIVQKADEAFGDESDLSDVSDADTEKATKS